MWSAFEIGQPTRFLQPSLQLLKISSTANSAIDIVNTVRPSQGGRHLDRRRFKCIFLNENACISIKIPPKFVPKFPVVDIQALVQIMAWRRPDDKPLSEALIV